MKGTAVGLVALAACGTSAPDPGCPAAQPALADCFAGDFFADCGGDGDPRLACNAGDCRWFTRGCVAAGFTPSDCPSDDLCCHDDWPYEDLEHLDVLASPFYWHGTAPWDQFAAATLTVEIDPTLTATETLVTCTGPDFNFGQRNPCTDPETGPGSFFAGDTLLASTTEPRFRVGWRPVIEIIPDGPDLTARLCVERFTDVFGTCSTGADAPTCATSGTITLDRALDADPTNRVLTFDATFDTGLLITGTLTSL